MKIIISLISVLASINAFAGSPICAGPGETKVSWPTDNPIWEFCYLDPAQSSATRGSSLEIRDAYLNGYLVFERSHVPMLFANYTSGTCYREWKDTNSEFLQADKVENPTRPAYTTCDVSTSKTEPVYNCPFTDVNDTGSSVGDAADCVTGVQVEKYDDKVVITTNHSAAWYKYSSRYTFYADGRIQPRFGFGNSDGTFLGTTHWHHAYWRTNFDIDGPDNDVAYSNDTEMTNEFIGMRNQSTNQTWMIKDSVTGRGYRIEATAEDYLVDVNVPPNNPNNYHNTDVMVTKYKLVNGIPEYSDTPGSNNLGNCSMNETNLVDNESLVGEDVVFWYRTAVNDIANIAMLCKSGGPIYYPVGDWGFPPDGLIYKNGFE